MRRSPRRQFQRPVRQKPATPWLAAEDAVAAADMVAGPGGSEVSPLAIDGVMYLTTGGRKVVALEPETGKELWAYHVTDGAPATRGLEFWAGDRQSPATVFFGTSTGKLIALYTKTGKLMPGFGNYGVVDMKPGALNGLRIPVLASPLRPSSIRTS